MFEPIPISEFMERTRIDTNHDLAFSWGPAQQVVSLRQIEKIEAVQLMHIEFLKKIIGRTILVGGNKSRVYEGCRINTMSISPRAARIGQRFVERKKYNSLLENFGSVLRNFSVPSGPTEVGAFIAAGKDKAGESVIAMYLPPIVEMNGSTAWTLLDGIHRNFIIERIGGVTPVIAIEGVKVPFPCSVHAWDQIKAVDEKPPIEERFFDLKPELFRDLKYVGIDG